MSALVGRGQLLVEVKHSLAQARPGAEQGQRPLEVLTVVDLLLIDRQFERVLREVQPRRIEPRQHASEDCDHFQRNIQRTGIDRHQNVVLRQIAERLVLHAGQLLNLLGHRLAAETVGVETAQPRVVAGVQQLEQIARLGGTCANVRFGRQRALALATSGNATAVDQLEAEFVDHLLQPRHAAPAPVGRASRHPGQHMTAVGQQIAVDVARTEARQQQLRARLHEPQNLQGRHVVDSPQQLGERRHVVIERAVGAEDLNQPMHLRCRRFGRERHTAKMSELPGVW